MKRQALHHTKMDRLMRELKVPRYVAVGILESLWHLTARQAPRGDIGRLSDEEIARGVDWRGRRPDQLISALVQAGWLDLSDEHRLVVHDWAEHCDEAVKKHIGRSGSGFATKPAPKLESWVYFIRGRNSGNIKIGVTEGSIGARLKSLQTGSCEPLYLIGYFRGTRKDEIALHKRFAASVAAGEWFQPSPELLRIASSSRANGCQRQPTSSDGRPPEPVPEPVPEPQPAALPPPNPSDEISWVKESMLGYLGEKMPAWGPPDDEICQRFLEATNGASLGLVGEWLKELHRSGKRPERSWAWFVTMAEVYFRPAKLHHIEPGQLAGASSA